ncbi:MAG: glycoside hydrolase family 11 protein [Polyangiaceae bacterium]
MKRCLTSFRSSFGATVACAAAAALVACASDGAVGGGAGSAGAPITGLGGAGASASAAGSSSGGAASGGAPSAGGTSSSGATGTSTGGSSAGNSATAGVASGGGASNTAGSAGLAGGSSAGASGAANTCPPATPLTGGKKYCSNTKGNVGAGYSYELWASGSGSGCMNVYGTDAAFSATWTGVEDYLARIGLGFDQTKTPAQIGTISSDFAETKTGNDGLVYVGIYGWTVNPLREYYIIDDWGTTQPAGTSSDGTPRTHAGTITVDGDDYEVWTHTRTNKPAITGDNMTFDQYFSVRHSARQCGHISVSEHFSKWIGLGLTLGKLVEAKLLVEAQDSTGSIDFTKATVVVK